MLFKFYWVKKEDKEICIVVIIFQAVNNDAWKGETAFVNLGAMHEALEYEIP